MNASSPGMSRLGYLSLVLLFCLTWSSAFPTAKLAISTSPPLLFLGLRFLGASLVLLAWAAWRGQLRQMTILGSEQLAIVPRHGRTMKLAG